jgi:hypothetical protein
MRVPTDKEIEEAKEYLRQRLDAELSMRTNLQIVMIEAAKQIIDISYRYKISPELFRFSANRQLQEEVDAIILSLLEIIEDYTYTLAVATHEDNKDAIITCITRESYYKPQNKMFHFCKTFCSKITLVNTIQNVILNPI